MDSHQKGDESRSPPLQRSRWLIAALAVLVVLLVVLLGLSLSFGGSLLPKPAKPSPVILEVTGVERNFLYLNGTNGLLGPAVNDSCEFCPVTVKAGSLVSFTLLTYRLNLTVPLIIMSIFLNSSIPTVPFGGWSCPAGQAPSCPPPAVTSSHWYLEQGSDTGSAWSVTLIPPLDATAADDGPVQLFVLVSTCSTSIYAWNHCG
jgi:hypothetical protein